MASSSWTDVKDIALVEAWEEVYIALPRRGQGVYGFRVIRLDCEKFERYYKFVDDSSQDLGEEDIKAVALINYRHKEGHDVEHVSLWETMRVWL
ncbi:hypothetical protein Hanom_Chr06g00554351 [Helianthus anomalus]